MTDPTTPEPPPAPGELRILPVHGIGEISPRDDLAGIIADACNAQPATSLLDGDVLVV
ncbi:MAG TPA: coenzyme F420-0:L-glutamate ligase, partial [Acidimicrobiaceae bacterium]|nr:coenzyme F420-0:L-glutamate ligase [Acidimicrobiaceae bacterium]